MSKCAATGRAMWKALAVQIAGLAIFGTGSALILAQPTATATDLNTGCTLNSIPSEERLTVSWTGDCRGGRADGVGDVIAFSAGKLRYILRGQFRNGDLERQISIRDCSKAECTDDVPPGLLRAHERAISSSAPPPSSSVNISPAVAQPSAQSEVRAEDAVYRGKIFKNPQTGVLSGEVSAQFFDGRTFQGTLRDGRKEGFGTYSWPDGQRYVGQWRDDAQDGKGTLTFANGDVYEGDFVANVRTGVGTLRYKHGGSYVGQWKNGLHQGAGTLTFESGDVYEGDFVDNERSGSGTIRYKVGGSYTGQWLRGVRHGRGVQEWPNGQRYDGDWQNDRKHGVGNMRFPDGNRYDGDWRDDRATGKSDILFASGDVYAGEVRDGVPHGQGIMRWGSGDRFDGVFDAGRPTANGVMTFLGEAVAVAPPPPVQTTVADVQPPVSTTATPVPVSRANLCAAAFNSARDIAALRRFLESFPDDECARHPMARQKISTWEEQARATARAASRALDERQANARAFIGSTVAFRQEFPFCVSGTGANCQRVVYVFDVKAKVRDVDVQRSRAQVQISEVTSLGNEKGGSPQLFAQGRSAATAEFRERNVGTVSTKSFAEVGLVGL